MAFKLISLKNGLECVEGFNFGAVATGLKKDGANDLGFIASLTPFRLAAVFTNNRFRAAPIKHFLRYENGFKTNFLLLNSKNANAMTGEAGINDIDEIFEAIKRLDNFKDFELINPIMSSTGVIGYRLDKERIIAGAARFNLNDRNSVATNEAIMTTDRFSKSIAFKVELGNGKSFNIAGICKGAGMINPSLATMLCFILTDADIAQSEMSELLKHSVINSFNAISVDGDTSTNDTVLMLASAKSGAYDKEAFRFALNQITQHLALQIVKDGEGSQRVVAFEVSGAKTDKEAEIAAKALSNSLLVKTAIFGGDPNWGRIASTIGASGVEAKEEDLVIYYDEVPVYDKNNPELDNEREQKAAAVMRKDSYKIRCRIGDGDGVFTAFGCDLGHDYVSLNADYRS